MASKDLGRVVGSSIKWLDLDAAANETTMAVSQTASSTYPQLYKDDRVVINDDTLWVVSAKTANDATITKVDPPKYIGSSSSGGGAGGWTIYNMPLRTMDQFLVGSPNATVVSAAGSSCVLSLNQSLGLFLFELAWVYTSVGSTFSFSKDSYTLNMSGIDFPRPTKEHLLAPGLHALQGNGTTYTYPVAQVGLDSAGNLTFYPKGKTPTGGTSISTGKFYYKAVHAFDVW